MHCLIRNYVWLRNGSSYIVKGNAHQFYKNTSNSVSSTLKSTRNFNNYENLISYRVNSSSRVRLGLSKYLGGCSNKFGSENEAQCQLPISLRLLHCNSSVGPLLLSRSLQPLSTINFYSTNANTEQTVDSKHVADTEKKTSFFKSISTRFLSSTPTLEQEDKQAEDVKKLSLFQKFRRMYRDYWYVLIPVHCATSICWFGSFYVAAKSGVDLVAIFEYLNVSESIMEQLKSALHGHAKHAGILAVAFAMYKIATPIRYAVTLGGTTFAINHLKKIGYIKPMPKKDELKHMYQVQKDIIIEKQQQLKKNVIEHFKETEDNKSDCRDANRQPRK